MISSNVLGSTLALLSLITPTTIAAPTADCKDPKGFQWAVYPNPFQADPIKPHNYPKFDPIIIKSMTPEQSGVAGEIGLYEPYSFGYVNLYDAASDIADQDFIIDHRFYLKTKVTGFYNFTITGDDDLVELWVGSEAFSGWTRDNALITYSTSKLPKPPISITFRLIKNKPVPMRIVFGQGEGPFNLAATLSDPNGKILLGPDTKVDDTIVQFSCKNPSAPPFPPYGSE